MASEHECRVSVGEEWDENLDVNFRETPLQHHLRRTTCRALPAGRTLGSERVTKMLKTPPKVARSGAKSTSLSETTLSDAVGHGPWRPTPKP
jgi:hypothetical protein